MREVLRSAAANRSGRERSRAQQVPANHSRRTHQLDLPTSLHTPTRAPVMQYRLCGCPRLVMLDCSSWITPQTTPHCHSWLRPVQRRPVRLCHIKLSLTASHDVQRSAALSLSRATPWLQDKPSTSDWLRRSPISRPHVRDTSCGAATARLGGPYCRYAKCLGSGWTASARVLRPATQADCVVVVEDGQRSRQDWCANRWVCDRGAQPTSSPPIQPPVLFTHRAQWSAAAITQCPAEGRVESKYATWIPGACGGVSSDVGGQWAARRVHTRVAR